MAEILLRLDIITPERTIVSENVNWVLAPGVMGEFQVYAEHTQLLTALLIGQITYDKDGTSKYVSISGGFCEVMPDRVLILAHTAEPAETIDRARAESARDRATGRLAKKDTVPIDEARAHVALQRAINRIRISELQ
jgi:F-type H+-transporting ATPase subunit epsilon